MLMTSGHMWNVIRGPPAGSLNNIFAGGFSQQFVIESQAIGVLYALIAVCFLGLVTKAPAIRNEQAQRLVTYLFLGGFLMLFSVLLSVFKIKNGGFVMPLNQISFQTVALSLQVETANKFKLKQTLNSFLSK